MVASAERTSRVEVAVLLWRHVPPHRRRWRQRGARREALECVQRAAREQLGGDVRVLLTLCSVNKCLIDTI